MLQAKEHAPPPSPFTIFTFGLAIESMKEFGGPSLWTCFHVLQFQVFNVIPCPVFSNHMLPLHGNYNIYIFFTWKKTKKSTSRNKKSTKKHFL
jgi:hypothetical protein